MERLLQNNIEKSAESLEVIKDKLFDDYMKQSLVEIFFDDLVTFVGEANAEKMRSVLADYDDATIFSALSLPYELREKKFLQFEQKLFTHERTPEELMEELVNISQKYGFGIGYHTSPVDIKPDAQGRWSIKGTEKDHRDDDRMMAYYSTKYRHLFKKKDPKFIYIVRTDKDTHKTDGNWSRGSELSVVAKVPFMEVFDFVEYSSREKVKGDSNVPSPELV